MQEQNETKKELCRCLTVWPDLGTMFGISRTKAYQLVKEPGFPALRLGPKRIVIPEDKLLHWLEHQAEIGLKQSQHVKEKN